MIDFTSDKKNTSISQVIDYLNNKCIPDLNQVAKETNELLFSLTTLDNANKELKIQNSTLQDKYDKLKTDFDNALLAFNIERKSYSSSSPVTTTSSGELFDPAIHTHKPKRPITNKIRLEILDAYETKYKILPECKTLHDFCFWIQDNICPSASRGEIEGVIYNRFDERLYQ